jgi:hypothetical protein
MRAYIANKMTGIPQFNIPWFDAAALYLREEKGIDVVSPAELDRPETRAAALASEDGSMGSGVVNVGGLPRPGRQADRRRRHRGHHRGP